MSTVSVIVGSTRQGRFSDKPAEWIFKVLQKRPGVTTMAPLRSSKTP
jgi:NAD(P)H-dependent FMN reductase